MSEWQKIEEKYYIYTVTRVPVTLVRGEGARVWDENGKEYLDFIAGWAVNSLGHCPPVVADALTEQANTLIQTSNQFYTIPQLQLARLLVENSCLDKVYVCNSGLEANEGAVKLARRYGSLKRKGAYEVITANNSFHGRSLAMTAATGQERFQKPYIPLPKGFKNVPFDDIEAIKKATTDKTCAVMLEPVQGEGGVNIPADDYLLKVREWCDENKILLILDEIQTGIGRLGTLFGYELYGIEPDIISLAKGLGSGVPVGAFMAKDEFCCFSPGEHGSTFGGNALTSAAAYATVKYIIDNDIPGNVKKVGQYLMKGLESLKNKYKFITDVRGRGLLVAIEFDSDIGVAALDACLERGLLVNRVKPNALRFMPPLIIGNSEVDEALDILDKALSSVANK
ncbi:aspartate aminotransferase family protein [Chloroflexota bacterium]